MIAETRVLFTDEAGFSTVYQIIYNEEEERIDIFELKKGGRNHRQHKRTVLSIGEAPLRTENAIKIIYIISKMTYKEFKNWILRYEYEGEEKMTIEQAINSFERQVRQEQKEYDKVNDYIRQKYDVHKFILDYLKGDMI